MIYILEVTDGDSVVKPDYYELQANELSSQILGACAVYNMLLV
jgi:hypothetical protein